MSNGFQLPDIAMVNIIHDAAMIELFETSIGMRALILSPSFPFIFIGEILDVDGDFIEMFVETTNIAQLEQRTWFIHLHQIEAFYIEDGTGPNIPELKEI